MRRLRIGVDIDGVLANSGLTIIETVNNRHGLNLTTDMIKDYWYNNPEISHAKHHIINAWKTSHEGELLATSPLMKHAQLFNMLPGKVDLITHRDKLNTIATSKWLYNNGFYNYESLVFVEGPKSQYGPFDYFIEDCMDNVHDLSDHVTGKILLVNHPYNIDLPTPEKVVRVNCWEEIIDFFKKELIRGV